MNAKYQLFKHVIYKAVYSNKTVVITCGSLFTIAAYSFVYGKRPSRKVIRQLVNKYYYAKAIIVFSVTVLFFFDIRQRKGV